MTIRSLVPLLNVADVGRSLALYRDALGFEVEQQAEEAGAVIWARLRAGEAALMLNRPEEIDSAGRAERPSYGDVVLYLTVENAAALHETLSAAPGELGLRVGPLERQDYGLLEFQLRDPDGYEVAVGSPLAG